MPDAYSTVHTPFLIFVASPAVLRGSLWDFHSDFDRRGLGGSEAHFEPHGELQLAGERGS